MRKFFEGHSFIGVAIILSVFAFAVFLRFYNLGPLSPWTDEVASWWYLRHLDEVWGRESHSPLYYGILRIFLGENASIFDIRIFSAIISTIHLIEFYFLGQMVFTRKQFLVFWILICLNPADIVYARMARHYAWLLEGTLVWILLVRGNFPRWLISITAVFMSFIHVFFVFPLGLLAVYDFFKTKNLKKLALDLLPGLPIVFYYLGRILFLSADKVRSNVSWNNDSPIQFLELITSQFLGNAYPHYMSDPVNFLGALLIVLAALGWILWKKKESSRLFLVIFLGSIFAVEFLSLWLNLRVNRYVIYFVAFLIFAISDSIDDESDRAPLFTLVLSLGILYYSNPLKYYAWDNEKVSSWREFRMIHATPNELVCANQYQTDYYQLNASWQCRNELSNIDFKRPLLFFDLNGNDTHLLAELINRYAVVDFRKLRFGMMVRFNPKDADGKTEK